MHCIATHGLPLPVLGFGTWPLRGAACRQGVLHALSLGYRLIDTAVRYENETDVGAAISASAVRRDEIVVVTKLGLDCRASTVAESVRASLRRLRTDYLDLLLMHWPSATVPLEETVGAMEGLRSDGLIRALGVSNFPPSYVDPVDVASIAANEVEYHPYLAQPDVLARARAHGHAVLAYSPLARGRVVNDPALRRIAGVHGKRPEQVALHWLVQQSGVAAIPRASIDSRRTVNLDIFDFELSTAEMQEIHDLDESYRLVNPPFAPDWERPDFASPA